MNAATSSPISPFHKGEREMQNRAGLHRSMDAIGKMVIRPFMPDQHRAFFAQLPFLVMGSVDGGGWPWASMLTGGPNFATSPTDKRLDLDAKPLDDDPLGANLMAGSPVGLLGIELSTRRRNRMNATVKKIADTGVSLDVVQSFGNCPQYIQTHDIHFVREARAAVERAPTDHFSVLDAAAQAFIAQANSFYVASASDVAKNPMANGVDVSHRGGPSGFLKVKGNTILVPDFAGNNFFNTLGNFLVNPKAGLLFPDFSTGDVLMLTGTTEVLDADAPEIAGFKGAERGWRFALGHGLRIYDALPFRGDFTGWSPKNVMVDTWAQTDAGTSLFEPDPEAERAGITFARSGQKLRWAKGEGTLLEIAEAHGITPPFSCRRGSCGSCLTKKLSGHVAYRTPVRAAHGDDEVLLCCAVPAKGTKNLILDL